MTLLRLIRSFGLRRGLALWLLPELESEYRWRHSYPKSVARLQADDPK